MVTKIFALSEDQSALMPRQLHLIAIPRFSSGFQNKLIAECSVLLLD